ncbi:glutathione S-transferase N-terminal domain-containing protein [Halodurantibacterium flavum]|uniref:Glutathione S-transferase N-terminal domain-containing protein n=1 Tax=Halodurantibacterium flavum TaxID=1382802 RepID=A0ABW4S196_9RHOB
MTQDFRPIVYLMAACPHCFKLRLFLLEGGLIDQVELRQFENGTPEEDVIRAELAPHFDKTTFPAAQIAPGEYLKESDALIDWFAERHGLDPARMATYQTYLNGPYRQILRLFGENRELRAAQR